MEYFDSATRNSKSGTPAVKIIPLILQAEFANLLYFFIYLSVKMLISEIISQNTNTINCTVKTPHRLL